MTGRIETERFDWQDPAAKAFYDEHGYVIVHGVLTERQRQLVRPAWDALVSDAAACAGLSPADFETRFPQNRDLWSKSAPFKDLLFASRQGEVAERFLGTRGARLFHDHAIAKPSRQSGTIPWHQDSTYWPVDRAGNSLWTPTEDVAVDGGCLRVLDGSHKEGPGSPQDFLRPDGIHRDEDDRLVHLPVARGETVVLHGLTWHSSAPNHTNTDRLAYLTLWIPASARFAPRHASWHPTTAHIEVDAGQRIEGRWFPAFGSTPNRDDGEALTFTPPEAGQGLTMFRASDVIRDQLRWLTRQPAASMRDLVAPSARTTVADAASKLGLERESVLELLADLELQERVREQSVARDVYLSTVQRWWHLAGHRIEQVRA